MVNDPVEAFLERHPLAVGDAESSVAEDLVAHRMFRDKSPPQLGNYQLLERIGGGGMGTVFRARDQQLDREVAIKFVRGARPDGSAENRRLQREARAQARVSHPNVVSIHEVNEDDVLGLYLVMEFVEGVTLGQWAAASERTTLEIAEKLRGAARGLAAAHRAGIVHRDLKPDNVLVRRDGSVRVADFGLARAHEKIENRGDPSWPGLSATLTRSGTAGTKGYVAPERLQGHPPDVAGDVFSFCVTAWEVLTGERPFANPPERAALVLPAALRPALFEGLRRDPNERSRDLAPVIAALDTMLRAQDRHPRRHLGVFAAVAGVLAFGGVAALWATRAPQGIADAPGSGALVSDLLGMHMSPDDPPSPRPLGEAWPPPAFVVADEQELTAASPAVVELPTASLAGDGQWQKDAVSGVERIAESEASVLAIGVKVLPFADRRERSAASPEAVGLRRSLEAVVQAQERRLPQAEVWVTAFGYDTHPDSPHTAGTELKQARWLMRGVLEMAAAGVGRAYVDRHRDRGEGPEVGMSSGLVASGAPARPRLSWYYLSVLREHLGALSFTGEANVGIPDVRAYRFAGQDISDRAIAIWSATDRDRIIEAVEVEVTGDRATLIQPSADPPYGVGSALPVDGGRVQITVTETPSLVVMD